MQCTIAYMEPKRIVVKAYYFAAQQNPATHAGAAYSSRLLPDWAGAAKTR